jgi:hypothetical protein
MLCRVAGLRAGVRLVEADNGVWVAVRGELLDQPLHPGRYP